MGGTKVFPKEFSSWCAMIQDRRFGNTGKVRGDPSVTTQGPHFSLKNPTLPSIKISFSVLSQLEVLDGSGFLVLLEWEGSAALCRSNGPVALLKPCGGDSSMISLHSCLPFLLIAVGSIPGAKPALESYFFSRQALISFIFQPGMELGMGFVFFFSPAYQPPSQERGPFPTPKINPPKVGAEKKPGVSLIPASPNKENPRRCSPILGGSHRLSSDPHCLLPMQIWDWIAPLPPQKIRKCLNWC